MAGIDLDVARHLSFVGQEQRRHKTLARGSEDQAAKGFDSLLAQIEHVR